MIRVLCFGCGVNSTAMLALLKLGELHPVDKIIFCDVGVEWPETYEYLEYISKLFKIEVLRHPEGSLYDYCNKRSILPSIRYKWCNSLFKRRLVDKELKGIPHVRLLGIDYGEKHRAKDFAAEHPLIQRRLDRQKCIEVIMRAGLKVPPKSGCWMCPMMSMHQMRVLKYHHPDKFKMLVDLEKQAREKNPKVYFKRKGFIEEYV